MISTRRKMEKRNDIDNLIIFDNIWYWSYQHISKSCNLHEFAEDTCETSWNVMDKCRRPDGFCQRKWPVWSNLFGWIIKHVSVWTDFTGLDTYCAHLGRSGYVTWLQTWSPFVHPLFLYCFDCFHATLVAVAHWRARISLWICQGCTLRWREVCCSALLTLTRFKILKHI